MLWLGDRRLELFTRMIAAYGRHAGGSRSATFVGVSERRQTVTWLWWLALAGAASCSVFPDEAALPGSGSGPPGGAGAGGSSVPQSSGAGGAAAGADVMAHAGEGGSPGNVGGAAAAGMGGVLDAPGGAGGVATCANPQQQVVAVTADTWIEAAQPSTGHGNDATLSIVSGGQEQRALFELTLPVAVAGAVMVKATLELHLETNADVGLVQRRLRVHPLAQAVSESRATWNNWSNGASRQWLLPGGDFGAALAETTLPAGSSDGALTFDLTGPIGKALGPQPVVMSFIVLESSASPPGPAELAFTSSEGDASRVPALSIEYCQP